MLSLKEKQICDDAYWERKGRRTYIGYVYFIEVNDNIIYIGCTINPFKRKANHIGKLKLRHYCITFYGPFKMSLAWKIEATEIAKHKSRLNNHYKKHNYDKEFSIENFKRTAISFIKEKGKRKEVVRKHTYKQHH